VVKGGRKVYSELVIRDKKLHARVSAHENRLHVHSFTKQPTPDGSTIWPFGRLQKLVPGEAPLVFLEMSHKGSVLGRVYLRLTADLAPEYRECLVHLATGQHGSGASLRGLKFRSSFDSIFADCPSEQFRGVSVPPLSNAGGVSAGPGDVVAWFGSGYLSGLRFQVGPCGYHSGCCIVGRIQPGSSMDLIKAAHARSRRGGELIRTITDCGLVLEQ
ncbi:unnamed protein product, partial [Meganyctiphanes norvegica]